MALQRQAYVSLDECITSYIDEADVSNHKYFRLWHIGYRGVTELGLDFFFQVKSVKLPISSTFTAQIPPDCVNWTKAGVLNQQGEIIPLAYNEKLTIFSDLSPNRQQNTTDDTIPTLYQYNTPIWFNYWNGGVLDNMYGLPSGSPFIGTFKIDSANGIILLSDCFGYDYVMLEYISSPQEGQEIYLPIQFKEAIIAYLRWKDIISTNVKTHMANSNIQMRRRDYYNERRLAIARYDPAIINQLYELNLEMQRLTVKV